LRILFCNIAWMDYYKGIVKGVDEPRNGGSYVTENGDAHEAYNFASVHLGEDVGYPEGDYCLGFVETKSTNKNTRNQLNIEKIDGCELCKKESEVDDILVIYCAKYPDSMVQETYVVGWYKHLQRLQSTEHIKIIAGKDIHFRVICQVRLLKYSSTV